MQPSSFLKKKTDLPPKERGEHKKDSRGHRRSHFSLTDPPWGILIGKEGSAIIPTWGKGKEGGGE